MAKSDDRVVTVGEVFLAWFSLENPTNLDVIYRCARDAGVEPDAVDVFGRPGWSPSAIARWSRKRDEQARQADETRAAWAQLERDSQAWHARRAAAVRQAQEAESRKAGKAAGADFSVGMPLQSPEDAARVRAAGRHAGEQFERANPRPRLNGNAAVPLVYVNESEEGSLLARAVGAVKGARVIDADRDPADEIGVM